jgi:hypothetical protein
MDDFSSIGQPQRLFDIVTLAITLLWRRKPGLAPNGSKHVERRKPGTAPNGSKDVENTDPRVR